MCCTIRVFYYSICKILCRSRETEKEKKSVYSIEARKNLFDERRILDEKNADDEFFNKMMIFIYFFVAL